MQATTYSLSNLVLLLVLWADLGWSRVLFAVCIALFGKIRHFLAEILCSFKAGINMNLSEILGRLKRD